jgi:glycosyltransferase involved in cell wall biosynthesis
MSSFGQGDKLKKITIDETRQFIANPLADEEFVLNADTAQSEPLISIIVAVRNGAKTLQRCIDSVDNQTYPYKELIIIDGGSTDGTVDFLHDNDDKVAYWESEPDRGIYHAWNKALEHIKGDWIYFLGADDYFWQSDVLERMRWHLVDATTAGVRAVYGQVAIVTKQGDILQIAGKLWGGAEQPLWKKMENIHPQGLMYHKSLFKEHGKFDESFRIAGDVDLSLRVFKATDPYFINGLIVAAFNYEGISADPLNKAKTLQEIAWAYRKNRVGLNRLVLLWSYAKAVGHGVLARLIGLRGSSYVADFYRLLTGRSAFWTRIKK